MRKPSRGVIQSERGAVKALVDQNLQAISCVARDDRDGCSRYRASKISVTTDELGWYRDFSPLSEDRGVLFLYRQSICNFLWRLDSNERKTLWRK